MKLQRLLIIIHQASFIPIEAFTFHTKLPQTQKYPPSLPRRQSQSPSSLKSTPLNNVEFDSPRTLVRKGMQSFRENDVSASLEYFDRADKAVPDGSLKPYLWQRGITYYYLDLFRDGSDQFRLDVSVNPLDVEEIVWDIACLARIDPESFPPPNKMALPRGKTDRRRIMSTVYSLFRGDGATEYDLFEAGHNGNISDEFYSLFYLGLYCEIRNEADKAEKYMKAAASSAYAKGPGAGDYMTSCARVHCKLRGWV